MKIKLILAIGLCFVSFSEVPAAPTSVFWTCCTTDVQPVNTYGGEIDNYFSVGHRKKNGGSLPPDIGLKTGLFSWEGLGAEAGIDYLGGASNPVYFHGKVALVEGRAFDKAPSISFGVFNVGTTHSTCQAVVNLIFGTTLPNNFGRAFVGGYAGRRVLGKNTKGVMLAYQKGFCTLKDASNEEYSQWQFSADAISGKNAIGGGGFAATYYFTSKISLQAGPVWFTDTARNGRWKLGLQLGINI